MKLRNPPFREQENLNYSEWHPSYPQRIQHNTTGNYKSQYNKADYHIFISFKPSFIGRWY